jgi:hypothetical protein
MGCGSSDDVVSEIVATRLDLPHVAVHQNPTKHPFRILVNLALL